MTELIIADPSPTIRKIVRITLDEYQDKTLEVTCRADLDDALEKVDPSLVILGLVDGGFNMSQATGFSPELLQKSLLLYSQQADRTEKDWKELGFLHVLEKPFTSEQLIESVRKVMGDQAKPTSQAKADEKNQEKSPLPPQAQNVFQEQLKMLDERSEVLQRQSVPVPPPIKTAEKQEPLPAQDLVKAEFSIVEDTQNLESPAELSPEMKDFLREEMARYCEKEFPKLAKEVIAVELKKLVEQRKSEV